MVSLAWLLVPMAKASGIVTILLGEDSPRIQRVCRNAPRKAGPTRSLLWLSITENDRQHGRTLILLDDDCAECNNFVAVASSLTMSGFWLRCIADLHPPVE